jgi:hypothetical protein
MTVPIIPGPFQFLAEAGQAATGYEQSKEERRRHGEEIAHRAITDLIGQIKDGLKPASVLADPEVKKLMKVAYGVSIPDVLLPQPKEAVQRGQAEDVAAALKEGGAARRAVTGVPSKAVAEAGEAQTEVKGAKAKAELKQNVPEKEASAEAAEAQAKLAGYQFNKGVYDAASIVFGKDPAFRQHAIDAATGVLDYKIRLLMLQKENLTIEKQLLANDARLSSDILKDADKAYAQAVATWQNNQRLSGEDEDVYEKAHPRPDQEAVIADFIKTRTGWSMDQFRDHMQKVVRGLFSDAGPTPRAADVAAAPAGQGQADTPEKIAAGRLSKADPQAAADALTDLVQTNHVSDLQARAIVVLLKEQQPASWFRKFNKNYFGGKP